MPCLYFTSYNPVLTVMQWDMVCTHIPCFHRFGHIFSLIINISSITEYHIVTKCDGKWYRYFKFKNPDSWPSQKKRFEQFQAFQKQAGEA